MHYEKKIQMLYHMSINIKYQVVLLIRIKKDEMSQMTTHTYKIKFNACRMMANSTSQR